MSASSKEAWQIVFEDLVESIGAHKSLLYINLAQILYYWSGSLDEREKKSIQGIAAQTALKPESKKWIPDIQKDNFFKHTNMCGAFFCIPLLQSLQEGMGSLFLHFDTCPQDPTKIQHSIQVAARTIAESYQAKMRNRENQAAAKAQENISQELWERYLTQGLRSGNQKILSVDPLMESDVFTLIKRYRDCSPILILGETGTGKELVASALHHHSTRQDKPYLPYNAGSLGGDGNMDYVRLFGAVEGVATDVKTSKGLFQLAHGGTLFLDEIGKLEDQAQVHLLRALEENKVMPLGAPSYIKVDVRIICASNVCLESLVSEGKFREDLMHRLKQFIIRIPPLRQRSRNDIELLAGFFLSEKNKAHDTKKHLSHGAIQKLCQHSWPGNVRELKAAVERAYLAVSNSEGTIEDTDIILEPAAIASEKPSLFPLPWQKWEEVEQEFYRQVIEWAQKDPLRNTKTKAAEMIGKDVSTLDRKIKEYDLPWPKK